MNDDALTPSEMEYLDAHGAPEPRPDLLRAAQIQTRRDTERQVREALTIADVADVMEIPEARVNEMVADGNLYAFPDDFTDRPGPLFPRWQFNDDGTPIPYVGTIVDALPEGRHPLAIEAFFANAVIEDDEGHECDVEEWLRSGGPMEPVLDLADAENWGL